MIDNILLFKHLTEFKEWIAGNRKVVKASLRKYKVARSYLVMTAIATIFTLVLLSIKDGGSVWYYLIIALSVFIVIASEKIAFFASGLSSFNLLPIVSLENETHFLKDIADISSSINIDLTFADQLLLQTGIHCSQQGKMKLAIFLLACIEIVDSIESSE